MPSSHRIQMPRGITFCRFLQLYRHVLPSPVPLPRSSPFPFPLPRSSPFPLPLLRSSPFALPLSSSPFTPSFGTCSGNRISRRKITSLNFSGPQDSSRPLPPPTTPPAPAPPPHPSRAASNLTLVLEGSDSLAPKLRVKPRSYQLRSTSFLCKYKLALLYFSYVHSRRKKGATRRTHFSGRSLMHTKQRPRGPSLAAGRPRERNPRGHFCPVLSQQMDALIAGTQPSRRRLHGVQSKIRRGEKKGKVPREKRERWNFGVDWRQRFDRYFHVRASL